MRESYAELVARYSYLTKQMPKNIMLLNELSFQLLEYELKMSAAQIIEEIKNAFQSV